MSQPYRGGRFTLQWPLLASLAWGAVAAGAAEPQEAPKEIRKAAEPDLAVRDRTFERLGRQFIEEGRSDGM